MEELKKKIVRISVRNLIGFILQSGDYSTGGKRTADKEAMLLGGKIHRKIQRSMGANYQAEVMLKHLTAFDFFEISVEGRADGIIEEDAGYVIDEIKGVFLNLHYVEKPQMLHLAQAKCYAYIYAKQQELKEIETQITYCNMETEEIKRFREMHSFYELEQWFGELVIAYEKWVRFHLQWIDKRNQSIKLVEFPFEYREGQKELVTSVYRTMLRKKKLFIQAPTGIGKTMATVFPAVKAMGEGLGDKIFYLTAKTITRTVAEQAFITLKEQNLSMKILTLTAKEKICFQEECVCNPIDCIYARGHFDRVNDAVYELLTTSSDFGREHIETHARKWKVCPFEMMLDLSLWADVIICDYNYLFDPNAKLKRFFSEGVKGNYLFLIDEAHNLVERGRDMYSAQIYKEEFLELKKQVRYYDVKLGKRLESCNKVMLEFKKECESYEILPNIGGLVLKLMNLMAEMERVMEECDEPDIVDGILDLYFKVRDFLNIHDRLDENYVIYSEFESEGRFKIKLYCVNPSVNIQECLDMGESTIYFSATLLPIQYYKTLLSAETDDYAIYVDSPFDESKRMILRGAEVSTKYTRRSESMYQLYADYIEKIAEGRCGNYMVFFPSYLFMQSVLEHFVESAYVRNPKNHFVVQSNHMNEDEREEFLSEFEKDSKYSLIGFCVMGGIFSEGIDLTEDRLIGSIIVGTGLPGVSRERDILFQHFQSTLGKGFDYAYLYPGMNKVLQSAGRVIRTAEDKGVIALLDERFYQRQYTESFPREWNKIIHTTVEDVSEKIKNFWENIS